TVAAGLEAAAVVIATAMVVEESPAAWRALAVAGLTVAAGAGVAVTTLAYPLLAPRWRILYLAGGAGLVAAALLWGRLPESRLWAAVAPDRLPVRLLLRPPWSRRLAVVAASGALGAILFQPAGLLVALFGSRVLGFAPTEISAVFVAAGVASIPAFLVGGRLADRLGRRRLGVGLAAATALLAALTFAGGADFFWAGNVAWSVLASAAAPIAGAWYAELFPTRARVSASAAAGLAVAFGGIVGLQLVGLLQPRVGLGRALVLCGACALAGALLPLALPETRGRPLPG
ncbi:MAG: MFS transporter, partial [Candidatus Dormibacteraeota bacterium]|nr:MFS transporter [Candidatus Dormibacteraeota bacterium]